jgi:hypothetical protein
MAVLVLRPKRRRKTSTGQKNEAPFCDANAGRNGRCRRGNLEEGENHINHFILANSLSKELSNELN